MATNKITSKDLKNLVKQIIKEEVDNDNGNIDLDVPSVLYHATYKPLLKKIQEGGLDTSKSKKAWEDSKPGLVYLAKDIDVAGSYAEASEMVPDSYLENIVVLHIDTSKLDLKNISMDKNVQDNEGDTLEYNGVIPWSAVIKVTRYF